MTVTRHAMLIVVAHLETAIVGAHRDLFGRLPSAAPNSTTTGTRTPPAPLPDPQIAVRYHHAQTAIRQAWHTTRQPLPPALTHPDRHAHPRALTSTVQRIRNLWSTLTADEQQAVLDQLESAAGKHGLKPWWQQQPPERRCHAEYCRSPQWSKGLCRQHYNAVMWAQRKAARQGARP